MHEPAANANRDAEIVSRRASATRALLRCGVAAGPLFLLIFVMQFLVRPEFRITRSEPSSLSIGPLGWIQIGNFILGGVLVIAGALGMRKVMRRVKGGSWGPSFQVVFGSGQVGVGLFVVDPIGSSASTTLHGTMHLILGGRGFVALIAACFVYVRAFFFLGQKGLAIFSAMAGLFFLAAFFSAASVHRGATSVQFFLNLIFILEWIWVALISAQILRNAPSLPA